MNVTALIPYKTGARKDWLRTAVGSLPEGMPYIVAENDGEMAEALNQALEMVNTEWVLFTGADDRWEPEAVQRMLDCADGADVVYPSIIAAEEESFRQIDRKLCDPFCPNRILVWNYVPGVGLWRTSKVREVGGFRDLDILEDWDLYVRLTRAGAVFRPCPDAWYRYRQVKGSRNTVAGDRTGFREEYQQKIVGERPDFKAAFLYSSTPGTAYVRAQLPARYLPGIASLSPEIAWSEDEHGAKMEFVDLPDTVVWQFPGTDYQALVAASIQESGRRFLVDVDDNLLSPGGSSKNVWAKRHDAERPSHWVHRKVVANADGVICATEALARIYRKVNPNVWVCPNQIDPGDWPEPVKPDDGVFRIGISGGSAHLDDVGLVLPALEWAAKQDGVEVLVVGMFKGAPGGRVLYPRWSFPYGHVDWANDLHGYRKNLGILDVGLCPVKDTPWNRCKSDLKVLEQSMAGAASIVSDVEPYKGWKNRPVLHARTPGEFKNQVQWAVAHRDEMRQMAAEAKQAVLAERTIQANVDKWQEAIECIGTMSTVA